MKTSVLFIALLSCILMQISFSKDTPKSNKAANTTQPQANQSCITYYNVAITNWTVAINYTDLQKGKTFSKILPPLFSSSCKPTYNLTLLNGGPVPEFVKTQFPNLTIFYGSGMALDLFGTNALYKQY